MNGDALDAILQGEKKPSPKAIQQPQDALDSALQGLQPAPTLPGGDALDEALKGTGHVTPPSLAHRIADFVVHGLIIEPLKDVSSAIKLSLTGPTVSREALVGGRSATFSAETQPGFAQPTTPEQIEEYNRAARGAALLASFAGGPIVKAAPVVGPLLGKWTSFLTGEFLGGAIYGGVRPLDSDESRGAAMLNDGAMFAATGGILKGVGEGAGFVVDKYKRYILALPRAKRMAAMRIIQAERSKVEASVGTTLDQVHPEAAAKLEEPILAQAIEQTDPGAVDLDAIVRAEADRAIEPTPRLGGERPALKLESPPEVQFEKELASIRERAATTVVNPTAEDLLYIQEGDKFRPSADNPVAVRRPDGKGGWRVFTGEDLPSALNKAQPSGMELVKYGAFGLVSHADQMDILRGQLPKSGDFEKGIQNVYGEFISDAEKQTALERVKHMKPIAGTTRGFEVTGTRKTPPVPTEPTVTEMLEGKKTTPEQITGVVVKGRSGKVHPALPGETHHAQIMARLMEKGTPSSEFINEETGAYSHADAAGYATNKRQFVSKNDAVKAGLEGATSRKAELPVTSPIAAEENLTNTVKEAVTASTPIPGSPVGEIRTEPPPPGSPTVLDQMKKSPPAFVGKIVSGGTDTVEIPLIDAATDHAVANINLTDVSTSTVKDAKTALDQVISDPAAVSLKKKPSANVKRVMEQALSREGPAAEQGVVLELTSPGPREINLDKVLPGMRRAMKGGKSELAKSLEESAPIEISMGEQIAAPGKEGAEQLVIPKELNGVEIAARLEDKQLADLKDSLVKLARGEGGRISGRLLIASTGGFMEALSMSDNLSPAEKASLRTIGGFLLLATVHPRLAEYFKNNQAIRKFLLQYASDRVMASTSHPELFQAYKRAMTESRAESIIKFRDAIREIVPLRSSHQAFMFAAEEGPSAPEWHLLTPNQQQAALVLNQLELHRGMLLKQEGVLDDYIDNYVRHLLPPKSYQTWRASGFKVLPVGGSFTKPRRINTLRELVDWTKQNGLEPPIMDPAAVYSVHNDEANRALAAVRLKASLDKVGLIQDFDPKTPVPDKWRPVSILGMINKIAPDEVATALENISSPRSSSVELINSLDTIKGYWMRSIMAWPWEHGLNVLRSIPAIATNPSGFADIWRAVKRRDPGLMEAARAGVDLFSRPDYGVRSHDAFQRVLGGIGLPGAGAAVDRKIEMMDRWLWEQIVPSLQYFAYSTRMHGWAERTGGKFLPSSVQYAGASHAAADFANIVAGRVPQELANPNLARAMRFAMFSPQWTTTRLALIAHAAGELSDIVAGKLDPRDAAYLPFKMRQLAWGFAITWLGSKLMSGNEPQFNPNSSKFYMRTGLRNAKGHEIGLDVIGWWESDIQAFNHPLDFMFNRLNPALKIGYETIQGRDYLGREMTTGQKISNVISSFGAGAAAFTGAADIAARELRGPPLRGGELLQMGSQASGAFNTATLPRPMDAAIAKFAKKILIRQNLPATNDNIFQLSRLLRSNVLAGTPMVDNQVINWLAYYKRSNRIANPVSSALGKGPPLGDDFQAMWQEARHVLAEF